MPPKRKARSSLASVSTPKTPTPLRDEDSVDVDTPQAADTPATPAATTTSNNKHNYPPDAEVLGNLWTADQESSLFKAIIRWKPTGMHKHFRMLSISEHLRNHGFDPDVEAHTRIPSIWAKLRTQYDLDIIDDRDNIYRGEAAGVVGDGGTGAGAGATAPRNRRRRTASPAIRPSAGSCTILIGRHIAELDTTDVHNEMGEVPSRRWWCQDV